MKTFLEAKQDFDKNFLNQKEIDAFLPVNLDLNKKCKIKNVKNQPNEEYYKWQFFYALVHSGLYKKDFLAAEVYFPKGNKNSAPIKFDGAIFDDKNWFEKYKKYHQNKDQESLDWLRLHLVGVIEFKKEDGKDIETVYNQQLKPAIKESELDFCLGILYDTERLFLFQKKNGKCLRLDEFYNTKGEQSTTKDMSLHLTDAYYKIPSFEQVEKRVVNIKIDRSKRTVDDLGIITGISSKQIKDGISSIIRAMDKVSMKTQRGYEILIQIMALKIYDEKRSEDLRRNLDFYKTELEKQKLDLLFYITPSEKSFASLSDDDVQSFIQRMKTLYEEASRKYHLILKRDVGETIVWEKEEHISVISEVVEQFQDYSFVKSHKTDLYQIVFSEFANAFIQADKGQFITPIPVIDFLVQIVNPRSDEKIIDPTCGIADFLSVSYINSKSGLKDENIYGVDNDQSMVMLAQLNMLLNGDGNSILRHKPDKGSIIWKFDDRGELVELDPKIHTSGKWDAWKNQIKLKKFDVVLTNPPFGEDRKLEPKNAREKEMVEMYELWDKARSGKWIDLGLIFLENAYRVLKENGRIGIVLSNSLASIDRWEEARTWLTDHMRIVGLFDLPSSVFADTGVNTTIIVAYKPNPKELQELKDKNYSVFVKDIQKIGYEIRTSKRVKFFSPMYKINETTFEVEQDAEGNPLLDEEFTQTIKDFKEWCLGQEKTLQDLFIREK